VVAPTTRDGITVLSRMIVETPESRCPLNFRASYPYTVTSWYVTRHSVAPMSIVHRKYVHSHGSRLTDSRLTDSRRRAYSAPKECSMLLDRYIYISIALLL